MSEEISVNSTKEEIANYFQKNFKIKEEVKRNFIQEDISGDILLDIADNEFKSLGIKIIPLKKIKEFLTREEIKFRKTKDIKEKITVKASVQEVSDFLEKCINFKKKNILDGKRLIQLDEEGMNELEFNLGQKKKLVKYINYFKTLIIVEEEKESEDEEIIINKNSTEEEVSNFLRKNSKLSQEKIDELGFDAETLISANNTYIDELDELNEEEKENLKKSLKKNQENLNLTINDKSTKKEVSKYLKVKLNFSNKIINDLKLDGKAIFNLEPNYIDKLSQLNKEEKDKFKNILMELQKTNKHEPIKNLTEKSTEEEVTEFFVKKLNFSEDTMEQLGLDGESLFLLKITDIDDLNISDKEKEIFKEYLNKIIKKPEPELKITYDSNKNDIANFLIKKINLKKDTVEKLDLDGETLLLLDEKDINEINILSKQEKDELIKVLKEINIKITDKSNSSDIVKFLKLNLDFEDKSINDCQNLTGRNFLTLKDEDINKKNNISEKDKKKLKKYLNLMNITINKESDKKTVEKFLKIQLSFSFESIKKLKIDGQNLMSLKEENIEEFDIKKEEKDKLKNLIRKPVQNIKMIEQNHRYNGFFILTLKKEKKNFKVNIFENQTKIEKNIIHIAEFSSRYLSSFL